LYGRALGPLALATAAGVALAFGLIFFYAPLDADQGFIQKIFYLHVPMAIVALLGFLAGGVMAAMHLRTRKRVWDMRSYVAVHLSIILAVGVLVTGSIWAKASWGHWWVWDEPVLVSFLIIFLLYAVYQPLRFSIDDPERQARYASVFAISGAAFTVLNFVAVRMAASYTHPRVFSQTGGNMPSEMFLTFLVALAAMVLLFATLWTLELGSKNAAERLRRERRRIERDAEGVALGREGEGGRARPASATTAPVPAATAPR
jgi:heme exporter protein C